MACPPVQQEHSFSQTEYYSQTQAQYTNHGTDKSQTQYFHSQTQADHPNQRQGHHLAPNEMLNCHGTTKKRGEHKKGLFHRIKDKISGDSSSSSDSESDDEKRGRGKSC